jgi:DNA-binding response OmpR family regulator
MPVLAFSVAQVWACLGSEDFAILVLDAGLSGDGLEKLCKSVHDRSDAALLVLLSPTSSLQAGFPYEALPEGLTPEEVAARGRQLVDRRLEAKKSPHHSGSPLHLDPLTREARWCGAELALTPVQFRILEILAEADGAVVSSRDLCKQVWGTSIAADHERLFAHIRRIRKKIEDDSAHPRFLLTARGAGYRLTQGY